MVRSISFSKTSCSSPQHWPQTGPFTGEFQFFEGNVPKILMMK